MTGEIQSFYGLREAMNSGNLAMGCLFFGVVAALMDEANRQIVEGRYALEMTRHKN